MAEEPHVEILMNLSDEDLRYLAFSYKNHEQLCYASSCIYNSFKIKEVAKGFPIKFVSPVGSRNMNHLFFVVIEIESSYEIGIFARFVNSRSAHEFIHSGLSLTRRMNFGGSSRTVVFKDVHQCFHYVVKAALESRDIEIAVDEQFYIYKLFKERASTFQIRVPSEVQLKPLESYYAFEIHANWPYFYPQSEEYIRTLIRINGGFGIFSKVDGELLSWGLKTLMGTIGFVQTVERARHKGYATIIVKTLAKALAQEGQHPVAIVAINDIISCTMFRNLGFENVGVTHTIHLTLGKGNSATGPVTALDLAIATASATSQRNWERQIMDESSSSSAQRREKGMEGPSEKDVAEAGPSWEVRSPPEESPPNIVATSSKKGSPKTNIFKTTTNPLKKGLTKLKRSLLMTRLAESIRQRRSSSSTYSSETPLEEIDARKIASSTTPSPTIPSPAFTSPTTPTSSTSSSTTICSLRHSPRMLTLPVVPDSSSTDTSRTDTSSIEGAYALDESNEAASTAERYAVTSNEGITTIEPSNEGVSAGEESSEGVQIVPEYLDQGQGLQVVPESLALDQDLPSGSQQQNSGK